LTSEVASVSVAGRRFEPEPHNCFACGSLNTHGMNLSLHVQGERCWTEIALPDRFEGWEGIAHGGIVCTLLDEVMAWALIDHDVWGLTARMTVNFKRPVPIRQRIRAEGWVTEVDRRLLSTAGQVLHPVTGELLATAQGVYVPATPDRKRQLQSRYRFTLVPELSLTDVPDTVDHS
jgi:acyl-coenzyme A thioesterase PaaI-like protein